MAGRYLDNKPLFESMIALLARICAARPRQMNQYRIIIVRKTNMYLRIE